MIAVSLCAVLQQPISRDFYKLTFFRLTGDVVTRVVVESNVLSGMSIGAAGRNHMIQSYMAVSVQNLDHKMFSGSGLSIKGT
jgi:hypothetical protein